VLSTPQALARLKEICQEPANRNKTVCVALNTVPGLPAPPGGLPSGAPTSLPTSLPSLPGLGRSATGPWHDAAQGGPTMAQLQSVYDPSLVNLLVPPMVVGGESK
jgi:phospholipid/cholesterol/gamma-HCH transport system substrate-binding protein